MSGRGILLLDPPTTVESAWQGEANADRLRHRRTSSNQPRRRSCMVPLCGLFSHGLYYRTKLADRSIACYCWLFSKAYPCVCSMTSGAIQQGVPTNVFLATGWFPQDPPRSIVAATPKSANRTWPVLSMRMLPACKENIVGHQSHDQDLEKVAPIHGAVLRQVWL